MNKKQILLGLILGSLLLISLVDLGVNIYSDKLLLKKVYYKLTSKTHGNSHFSGGEENRTWANKILDGGYILYVRHAERDKKWVGTGIYDLLESDVHDNGLNGTRYGENDYFSEAVCLTKKGKVQARAMGEHFKLVGVPVGSVISSPSCRARQTAEIMLGGYDSLDRNLVQTGVFYETKEDRYSSLAKLFETLPLEKGKNTVITAHGNVVIEGLFENPNNSNLKIDQGGFIILSRKNGMVKVEHSFDMFNSFIRTLYHRR